MISPKQRQQIIGVVAREVGISTDLIDEHHIDSSLSYGEAKELLLDKYRVLQTDLKISKEQLEQQEAEMISKEFKHLQTEQQKEITNIKQKTNPEINKYFFKVQELIKTVVKSKTIHGLLLLGCAGIGKSFQVIYTLNKMGKKLEEDYIIISSYVTPMELFKVMYNNKDKIIILDDIFSTLKNDISRGLLMSATWSVIEKRVVQYISSTSKLEAPKKFEFTGKILFLTNQVPKDIEPLKSRWIWYDIRLSHKEKIKLCYELCKKKEIPLEIMDWIEETLDESYDVSMRTPLKVYDIYLSNEKDWKQLAKTQFSCDEDLKLVRELLNEPLTTNERIKKFTEECGKSRATYFRVAKQLKSRIVS